MIIEGDDSRNTYNNILASAGAGISYSAGGTAGVTPNIHPHVTTAGIASIALVAPFSKLTLSGVAVDLVDDMNAIPNAACSVVGMGRIFCTGDELFINSSIGSEHNQLFGNQVFDWLAPVAWLSALPTSGSLLRGDDASVLASFATLGLAAGDHFATIVVSSNDADEPVVPIPVRLRVLVEPDIALTTIDINFGRVGIGMTGVVTLGVSNTGAAVLTVQSVGAAPAAFTADPVAFSLAPGEQRAVTVGFHPDALGTLYGSLTIVSNDPDESPIQVALQGEGYAAPEIALSTGTLTFGTVEVGSASPETLVVSNSGHGPLLVRRVGATNLDFTPDASTFTVAPLSSRPLVVTFRPSAPGHFDAGLVIESDDHDEGALEVRLLADATYHPHIDVSPDTVTVDVISGQEAAGGFSVHNTWSSPVAFSTEIVTAPGAAQPVVPGMMRALIVQDVAPWGTTINEQILSSNGIPYDISPTWAIPATDLSLYRLVIISSDQWASSYRALSTASPQLAAFVDAGGILEIHAAAGGWGSGDVSVFKPAGGLLFEHHLATTNDILLPEHPLAAGVPDPLTGAYVSHTSFAAFPAHAERLIDDERGQADFVTYRYGSGAVLAAGQALEFAHLYGQPASALLNNMIPFAARMGASWLSSAPRSGIVEADETAAVPFTLSAADLEPGDFRGDIVVTSSIPYEPWATVHVTMRVHRGPVFSASTDTLDFGRCFLGVNDTLTFQVSNAGDQPLVVTGAASSLPDYTVDPSGFPLEPAEQRTVRVVLAATRSGVRTARIEFGCNDPGPPPGIVATAKVFLLHPADVEILPGAVEASVQPGMQVERHLAVSNTGEEPLFFEARVGSSALKAAAGSVEWASVTPAAGTVGPGGQVSLTIRFDASDLDEGEWSGLVIVTSNDPDEPTVARDLILHVGGVTQVEQGVVPAAFALRQNVPNPFGNATVIGVDLPSESTVRVIVFDAAGRHVATLADERLAPGRYEVAWNGRDRNGRSAASGIYFCRMLAGRFQETKRMLLIR